MWISIIWTQTDKWAIFYNFLAQCAGGEKTADKALISQIILHIFFYGFQATVQQTQTELLDFDLLIIKTPQSPLDRPPLCIQLTVWWMRKAERCHSFNTKRQKTEKGREKTGKLSPFNDDEYTMYWSGWSTVAWMTVRGNISLWKCSRTLAPTIYQYFKMIDDRHESVTFTLNLHFQRFSQPPGAAARSREPMFGQWTRRIKKRKKPRPQIYI